MSWRLQFSYQSATGERVDIEASGDDAEFSAALQAARVAAAHHLADDNPRLLRSTAARIGGVCGMSPRRVGVPRD